MNDPRDTEHVECDCVPNLGPTHCHLCGTTAGHPVTWEEAHGADGIEQALSYAPTGARCKAEGFTDFTLTPHGWQQADTGWMVATSLLAEMIHQRIGKTEDSEEATK